MTDTPQERLLVLTSQIVSAHVSHNNVNADALPHLINAVYQSLRGINQLTAIIVPDKRPEPAVSPRRSVFPEYIVCLDDGKKLKMLKRHLKTSYGLTPEQYRERWNLPPDYPMVAPNYAKQRSRLAKQIGLGTTPRRAAKEKSV